ncbi:RHS repeat-associated core domain-containing protein [Pseudomonas sp. SWRI12]|uniref:RHS repeat-associated core domain-containing protein n=1 Tax=Pseudomonas zanjanensis TaxID=2745496 RepID=A0A923FAT8_9PSED|nr:RHS repeat-associated core domain-containing protein [Pseudomonas zanjanensis]MBV4494330.1 RHS repeat-associated core domain-containing protein [Pseudomonas zanjanensis]
MSATRLCTYRYDPLDRLTHHALATHAPIQRFYCKSRLATEIEGVINRSIVQHGDQLLALTETQGNLRQATLLATDQQRSVLQAIACNESQSHAYSPYGNRTIGNGLLSLLGFNGQRPDPVTGHYLLGNGYRAFNPVLMRFNSPDSWSPFGRGGLNSYTYCLGDPINKIDPTGHLPNFFAKIFGKKVVINNFYVSKRGVPADKAHKMYQRILDLEGGIYRRVNEAQHAAFNQDKLLIDSIDAPPQDPSLLRRLVHEAAQNKLLSHYPTTQSTAVYKAATDDLARYAPLFKRIDESRKGIAHTQISQHIYFATKRHKDINPWIASLYTKKMESIRSAITNEVNAEIQSIKDKYFV